MNRYSVAWTESAQNDLAHIWNNAADKARITQSADAIDAILARDPISSSESREGKKRIMVVMPLVAIFPGGSVALHGIHNPLDPKELS